MVWLGFEPKASSQNTSKFMGHCCFPIHSKLIKEFGYLFLAMQNKELIRKH